MMSRQTFCFPSSLKLKLYPDYYNYIEYNYLKYINSRAHATGKILIMLRISSFPYINIYYSCHKTQ